jgi:hypothetical protein
LVHVGDPDPSVSLDQQPPLDPPQHSLEKLIGRVPFFVRKKARANVEKYAREHNLSVVTEGVMLRAREHFGG